MHDILCECALRQGLKDNEFNLIAGKLMTNLKSKNTEKQLSKNKNRFLKNFPLYEIKHFLYHSNEHAKYDWD